MQVIQLVPCSFSVRNGKSLISHLWFSDSGDQATQSLLVLLKTEAKTTLNLSTFSSSLLVTWASSTSLGSMFSLDLLLLLLYFKKPFLFYDITLASFNCIWALAFCVFSLHIWRTGLYSSFEGWSCSQRSHIFFPLELHEKFPVWPSWSSAPLPCPITQWNCLLFCF